MSNIKRYRLGKFNIPREVILENPEIAIAITNGMLVFRAEMMFHMDAIEYIAISPMFDEIDNGAVPLDYEIIAEKMDDGIKIKARNL